MASIVLPVFLFAVCTFGVAIGLLAAGVMFGPKRSTPVKEMPYESGMNPVHDTRRRFDIRFHLVAIAFLVFDVELLFLYPWAVAAKHPEGVDAAVAAGQIASRDLVFFGTITFMALLALGLIYDWRKGVFRWR
jgi:NADH-quinone oxidoreductase subunit A